MNFKSLVTRLGLWRLIIALSLGFIIAALLVFYYLFLRSPNNSQTPPNLMIAKDILREPNEICYSIGLVDAEAVVHPRNPTPYSRLRVKVVDSKNYYENHKEMLLALDECGGIVVLESGALEIEGVYVDLPLKSIDGSDHSGHNDLFYSAWIRSGFDDKNTKDIRFQKSSMRDPSCGETFSTLMQDCIWINEIGNQYRTYAEYLEELEDENPPRMLEDSEPIYLTINFENTPMWKLSLGWHVVGIDLGIFDFDLEESFFRRPATPSIHYNIVKNEELTELGTVHAESQYWNEVQAISSVEAAENWAAIYENPNRLTVMIIIITALSILLGCGIGMLILLSIAYTKNKLFGPPQ